MTNTAKDHGEPPSFAKWLIWLFRRSTWKGQPLIATVASIVVISTIFTATYGVITIFSGNSAKAPNDSFLAALKEQADSDPPYYGNSSGNVRPQMEAYIKGFVFPKNCPGTEAAANLLRMIDEKANEESPGDYFDADNDFRAALDRFRTKVRTYTITEEWPVEY